MDSSHHFNMSIQVKIKRFISSVDTHKNVIWSTFEQVPASEKNELYM
jgi:hypothetical protein